jgi:hypothetical protein
MGKTPEQLDDLLKVVRDEDVATLRALEQRLHSLLEQKEKAEAIRGYSQADHEALSMRCPNVRVDPDLLTLVGIHPESPVEQDKFLIRESIARRLTD